VELSREYGIFFLPGVELDCSWRGQSAHVLAYFPRGVPAELEDFIVASIHAGIRKTAETLISIMANHGVEVTVEEYNAEIESEGMHGSPLLRLMMKKGIVRDALDYTARFSTEEYKTDCSFPAVTKAVASIKEIGGVVVLAHPGTKGRFGICDMREDDIRRFAEAGISGVEVYHPLHSAQDTTAYAEIADRLHLIKTGGSDSHGRPLAGSRTVGGVFCDWGEIEQSILR